MRNEPYDAKKIKNKKEASNGTDGSMRPKIIFKKLTRNLKPKKMSSTQSPVICEVGSQVFI